MGLEEQLIFNNLKLMYNVKHGLSPIEFEDYFTISEIEKSTNEKIEPKPYKKGARKTFAMYTLSQRIDKYWNYLPKETRNTIAAMPSMLCSSKGLVRNYIAFTS